MQGKRLTLRQKAEIAHRYSLGKKNTVKQIAFDFRITRQGVHRAAREAQEEERARRNSS